MNKKLKVLLTGVVLMFVLLIVAGIVIVASRDKKTPPQQSNQSTNQQQKPTPNTEKSAQNPSPSTGGTSTNTSGNGAPKPEEEKKKPWFSLELIYAQQAGNIFAVRAEAKGTSKGTCELELSKPGMPSVKRKAELGLDTDRDADKLHAKTICLGFSIPLEQIYASGKWNLKLVLKVDDVESEPIEKKVDIKR